MVAIREGIIAMNQDLTGETAYTFTKILKVAQSENEAWNKVSNENPGRGLRGGWLNLEFPVALTGTGLSALDLTITHADTEGGSYTTAASHAVSNYDAAQGTFSVKLPDTMKAFVKFTLTPTLSSGSLTAGTVNAFIGERVPEYNY